MQHNQGQRRGKTLPARAPARTARRRDRRRWRATARAKRAAQCAGAALCAAAKRKVRGQTKSSLRLRSARPSCVVFGRLGSAEGVAFCAVGVNYANLETISQNWGRRAGALAKSALRFGSRAWRGCLGERPDSRMHSVTRAAWRKPSVPGTSVGTHGTSAAISRRFCTVGPGSSGRRAHGIGCKMMTLRHAAVLASIHVLLNLAETAVYGDPHAPGWLRLAADEAPRARAFRGAPACEGSRVCTTAQQVRTGWLHGRENGLDVRLRWPGSGLSGRIVLPRPLKLRGGNSSTAQDVEDPWAGALPSAYGSTEAAPRGDGWHVAARNASSGAGMHSRADARLGAGPAEEPPRFDDAYPDAFRRPKTDEDTEGPRDQGSSGAGGGQDATRYALRLINSVDVSCKARPARARRRSAAGCGVRRRVCLWLRALCVHLSSAFCFSGGVLCRQAGARCIIRRDQVTGRWARPYVGRTGQLVRPAERWGQWVVKFDNEELDWCIPSPNPLVQFGRTCLPRPAQIRRTSLGLPAPQPHPSPIAPPAVHPEPVLPRRSAPACRHLSLLRSIGGRLSPAHRAARRAQVQHGA